MNAFAETPIYEVFGIHLVSNVALKLPLAKKGRIADVMFVLGSNDYMDHELSRSTRIYSSTIQKNGKGIFSIYRLNENYVLSFLEVADFYLYPERIECVPSKSAEFQIIEECLFSSVLSFWLEVYKSRIILHASSVVIDDVAIGFLGNSGNGKSTIATSFLIAGYPFLTDDILSIEQFSGFFNCYPGLPQIRLFPKHYEKVLKVTSDSKINIKNHEKLIVPLSSNLGKFCSDKKKLHSLYVINRCAKNKNYKVEIVQFSARKALVELLRYSFSSRGLSAAGYNQSRLQILSKIAKEIRIKQINYPSGEEFLPIVRETILKDVCNNLIK